MMRAHSRSMRMRPTQSSRPIVSYIFAPIYKISKSMMPKISDTERAALNAGTGKCLHKSAK